MACSKPTCLRWELHQEKQRGGWDVTACVSGGFLCAGSIVEDGAFIPIRCRAGSLGNTAFSSHRFELLEVLDIEISGDCWK